MICVGPGDHREAAGSDPVRFEEVMLLALTMEAGPRARECRQLPSAGRGRRQVFPEALAAGS